MRSTLAIYITLSAVAVVAIAQILYFKLVLAHEHVAEDVAPDMGWLREPVEPVMGEGDELEPLFAPEPLVAPEPVLIAA